ncbi:MAG: tyrosine decarboxylase MfnA [Candidatus Thorarchaeota archaeon]|nr:tyrosine decarboxylase MfnA [Candidatus Thorarchaeota archaeon]
MFEERGKPRGLVLEELGRVLQADSTYSSGRPVASMSTTPHDIGVEVFMRAIEKNAARFHTFKGSERIEKELLSMLGELMHLDEAVGTTTSGGTESNVLAMLAAREAAKDRTTRPVVIAPETIHSSVDKAAWLLGVKLVKTRVDREFRAVPEAVMEAITKDTVGIFATAGSTYLGQVDPIPEIAGIAADHSLPLHVDAAFGGFVIPFLRDLGLGEYQFDFAVRGVTSISIDPHKMGLVPVPAGCILFRDADQLKRVTYKVPYLRGESSLQRSILGTRPAGSIIAAWAVMRHLGREGYRRVVAECMRVTMTGAERIERSQSIQLALRPLMNILAIQVKKRPIDKVVDEMETRGWRMAISPNPQSIRVIVMPHVTQSVMTAFLDDLEEIADK